MFNLFRALIDRLKALFATTAAHEFEAEFLARHAERKAELLRQAARYEEEGLRTLAAELRQQAETLSIRQPLATGLPAVAHFQADHLADPPLLTGPAPATPAETSAQEQFPAPSARKKGR